MKMVKFMMEDKESEVKEEPAESDICCCTYSTTLVLFGVLFILIGILLFLNIIGLFLNKYFHPLFSSLELCLFFVYFAALIIIMSWWCNDTKPTRTGLRVAAYLIIGSIVVSAIVAIVYVTVWWKTKYVMVGTGDTDDPENYDQ